MNDISVSPSPCDPAPTAIGVVIPFFQRQRGLLRIALESINAQTVLASGQVLIEVAIVDDSSPVPAEQELEGFVAMNGVVIKVQQQANGGAGAARNTAIAMLDKNCKFVAFLDSDDAWSANHLKRALEAMANGADFFFCDAVRGEDELSQNNNAPAWFCENLQAIGHSTDLFLYSGPTDVTIVNGLVPTTSTIVHRYSNAGGLRFPSRYFRFGEDQYYCLQFLATQSRIAYSSAVEVFCGRGVNIFAGNAPGSEGHRLCLIDEIAFRKDALKTLSLSPQATQHVERKLLEAQQILLTQGLWLARGDRGSWLRRAIFAHPSLLLRLPSAILAVLASRRQHRTQTEDK